MPSALVFPEPRPAHCPTGSTWGFCPSALEAGPNANSLQSTPARVSRDRESRSVRQAAPSFTGSGWLSQGEASHSQRSVTTTGERSAGRTQRPSTASPTIQTKAANCRSLGASGRAQVILLPGVLVREAASELAPARRSGLADSVGGAVAAASFQPRFASA